MKTRALQTLAVIGVASVALASSAMAASFVIYSTGESSTSPVTLYPKSTDDTQYTIVQSGGTSVVTSVLTAAKAQTPVTGTEAATYTTDVSTWAPNTSSSKWIAPVAYIAADAPQGIYGYQTTFSLPSFTSALITGDWAADNTYYGIYLNGVLVAGTTDNPVTSTADYSPLSSTFFPSISTGFDKGINTLDFFVYNKNGNNSPTGVQIQLNGSYVPTVPEPSTVAVYTFGSLALLGFVVRKKRIS